MYEGQWFLAVISRDQENVAAGYTRLRYMTIKGNNSFAWGKEDVHDALDEDIIMEPVIPVPVNSRDCLGLTKKDYDKVSSLVVVIYPFSSCFILATFSFFLISHFRIQLLL